MTDRARELLGIAIEEWDSDRDLYEFHKVMEEIRAYLAEPEVKPFRGDSLYGQDPLSEDQIKELWWEHALPPHEDEAPKEQFTRFTRAVEKHHGISGGGE